MYSGMFRPAAALARRPIDPDVSAAIAAAFADQAARDFRAAADVVAREFPALDLSTNAAGCDEGGEFGVVFTVRDDPYDGGAGTFVPIALGLSRFGMARAVRTAALVVDRRQREYLRGLDDPDVSAVLLRLPERGSA